MINHRTIHYYIYIEKIRHRLLLLKKHIIQPIFIVVLHFENLHTNKNAVLNLIQNLVKKDHVVINA